MRRKSERTAGKKAIASPEKKIEKTKRTRTRRRKQSSSSENESVSETNPVEPEAVIEVEKKLTLTPKKADSTEETQDQVWQVKAAEGSGDMGEIQKLKICLTRPPSTPERVDRSPRSKRKHSRATSSSDTPSVEAVEERKKSRHRSKRSNRESRDESEKNHDSQEELETEVDQSDKIYSEITQSSENKLEHSSDENNTQEVPMSTTNEDAKSNEDNVDKSDVTEEVSKTVTEKTKSSDADTTVVSPSDESVAVSQSSKTVVASPKDETTVVSTKGDSETIDNENSSNEKNKNESVDKSEILELHAEDTKLESSDNDTIQDISKQESQQEKNIDATEEKETSDNEVSKNEEEVVIVIEQRESIEQSDIKVNNETDVVDSSHKTDGEKAENSSDAEKLNSNIDRRKSRELERSESTNSTQEESTQNGSTAPITISRKRRWGSRAAKVSKQRSITISTDVLKEIIPDVKPVEFDEVIEEKKHKRVEVSEKIERPVLPKIVIDNTENVELNRKEKDHEESENDITKSRESHLSSNRKISIVNDSIIARPPSPPRHKQSCILFITNLVRPFTLPQLKNLLQRTGRIEENGFWIDRIKSKCFVKYETEDQAVETRHALHGVTWPVSNPKTLQVDFSTQEAFDKAKMNEETDNAMTATIPGTVEDWLREQDLKRERGELDKPWERKAAMREWDVGKGEKEKEKDKLRRDERPLDKRRHRTPERSPEPARKFKKKEEEAPAKLLDDLFRKTKTTPCIYWLPLSAETIAIKEEQRRQHMAEHERRILELRRTHRRH